MTIALVSLLIHKKFIKRALIGFSGNERKNMLPDEVNLVVKR